MKKGLFWAIVIILSLSNLPAESPQYLIITYDKFYDAVQPLAQWKQKKGIPTQVVKLSEIGGNNPEAIRTYLRSIYNLPQRPEYILLVGDVNLIQPYRHSSCGPTDNPYADMVDDAQIEYLLGRLPCRNRGQLKSMINKIFLYERTPFLAETLWYRKVTTIRQDPGPYHNDGVNFVRSMILDNSDFISVDTLVNPSHNRRDLRDSICSGRSYILYTGHGAGTRWVSPFNLPPTIKNYRKLLVIFSWCCETVLKRNYLGQRWLITGSETNPKGAVAYIGTTTSGLYAPYRNFVARNFFRAIFQYKTLNIGKALKQGLDSLWMYTPDSFGLKLYSEWNLLGDPEMNLWTSVPQPMAVAHETIIGLGEQSFNINVTAQDGMSIPNALVCVMMPNNPDFYYHSYTDSLGMITFNINPTMQDSIWVTVTAQNRIPYEGKCLASANSCKSTQSVTANGKEIFKIYPNPVKSYFTVRLPQTAGYRILKIFDAAGKVIKVEEVVSLRANEYQVSLDRMNSGVYFVCLETETNKEIQRLIILK